jgi:hypothetical protein
MASARCQNEGYRKRRDGEDVQGVEGVTLKLEVYSEKAEVDRRRTPSVGADVEIEFIAVEPSWIDSLRRVEEDDAAELLVPSA